MVEAILLADSGGFPAMLLLVAIVPVAILAAFLVLFVRQYKRCPSNRLLVIYGKTGRRGQSARVIHGGAAFVLPLLQDYGYLSLEPIRISIPPRERGARDRSESRPPDEFTVAIGTDPELMQNAAIRLLGLNQAEVEEAAKELILEQLDKLAETAADASSPEEIDRKLEQALAARLRSSGLELAGFRRR